MAEELEPRGGFRRARADFASFAHDMDIEPDVAVDRDRLIDAVAAFFETRDIKADFEVMEKASDEALVTALAMVCPLDAT